MNLLQKYQRKGMSITAWHRVAIIRYEERYSTMYRSFEFKYFGHYSAHVSILLLLGRNGDTSAFSPIVNCLIFQSAVQRTYSGSLKEGAGPAFQGKMSNIEAWKKAKPNSILRFEKIKAYQTNNSSLPPPISLCLSLSLFPTFSLHLYKTLLLSLKSNSDPQITRQMWWKYVCLLDQVENCCVPLLHKTIHLQILQEIQRRINGHHSSRSSFLQCWFWSLFFLLISFILDSIISFLLLSG